MFFLYSQKIVSENNFLKDIDISKINNVSLNYDKLWCKIIGTVGITLKNMLIVINSVIVNSFNN